jgi:hypothetical protein
LRNIVPALFGGAESFTNSHALILCEKAARPVGRVRRLWDIVVPKERWVSDPLVALNYPLEFPRRLYSIAADCAARARFTSASLWAASANLFRSSVASVVPRVQPDIVGGRVASSSIAIRTSAAAATNPRYSPPPAVRSRAGRNPAAAVVPASLFAALRFRPSPLRRGAHEFRYPLRLQPEIRGDPTVHQPRRFSRRIALSR